MKIDAERPGGCRLQFSEGGAGGVIGGNSPVAEMISIFERWLEMGIHKVGFEIVSVSGGSCRIV